MISIVILFNSNVQRTLNFGEGSICLELSEVSIFLLYEILISTVAYKFVETPKVHRTKVFGAVKQKKMNKSLYPLFGLPKFCRPVIIFLQSEFYSRLWLKRKIRKGSKVHFDFAHHFQNLASVLLYRCQNVNCVSFLTVS